MEAKASCFQVRKFSSLSWSAMEVAKVFEVKAVQAEEEGRSGDYGR